MVRICLASDGEHIKIKVPSVLHRICCEGFCKAGCGVAFGIECLIVAHKKGVRNRLIENSTQKRCQEPFNRK